MHLYRKPISYLSKNEKQSHLKKLTVFERVVLNTTLLNI